MIDITKKALEFLVKNPKGPVSNLKGIHPKIIEDFQLIGYLKVGLDKYKLTQTGLDSYKNIYAPVSFGGKILSLIFTKILRIKLN